MSRQALQWRESPLPEPHDRERLWDLQRRLAELAAVMPLSAPAILDLAAEIDLLVNRLMGLATPVNEHGKKGDPAPRAEDRA